MRSASPFCQTPAIAAQSAPDTVVAMKQFRSLITLAALALIALLLAACSTPEQIQRRKLKTVDERRDISLAYVGSCQLTKLDNTCVDFYANVNATMKQYALKNCTILDAPCDRMAATTICLSPAQKGDALIQYELIFPPQLDAGTIDRECHPDKNRELIRL